MCLCCACCRDFYLFAMAAADRLGGRVRPKAANVTRPIVDSMFSLYSCFLSLLMPGVTANKFVSTFRVDLSA